MSGTMQPISSLAAGTARLSAAAGVREAPGAQRPEDEVPARSPRPAMDEYTPEEKREPSGRYWLGRDEEGRPKVYFDDPERAADEPEGPARPAGDSKTQRCTGSTDQVDREIERLRRKKEELERKLSGETDEGGLKELERKLAQVERELSQKDNDTYRRQHTVFS